MKANSLKRKATVSEDTFGFMGSVLLQLLFTAIGVAKENKTEIFQITTLRHTNLMQLELRLAWVTMDTQPARRLPGSDMVITAQCVRNDTYYILYLRKSSA